MNTNRTANQLRWATNYVQTWVNASHKSPVNAIRNTHRWVYCTQTLSNAFLKSPLIIDALQSEFTKKKYALANICCSARKTLETLEIEPSFHSHCIFSRDSHAHLQQRNATSHIFTNFLQRFNLFLHQLAIFCVKHVCTPTFIKPVT